MASSSATNGTDYSQLILQSVTNVNAVQSQKKLGDQSKYTFIIYAVVVAITILLILIVAINLFRTRTLPPRKVDQQEISIQSDSNLDLDESVCLPANDQIPQ